MPDTDRVRVVHLVATRQRRGAEIFAADLVDQLAREGVDQRVVALRDRDGDAILFNAPTLVLEAGSSGPLRVHLRGILRLRRLLRSWGTTVLQAHGGEALKYAVPAVLGGRAAVSYRRIGSTSERSVGAVRSAGLHRLIRRAGIVIAVSEAARHEVVQRFGVDERRVVRIPNAVDVVRASPARSRLEVRRNLGIPDSSEVVVSVGALNWEKDPLGQVDIFERVAKARPRAMFAMVGTGGLEADTRLAVAAKGLGDRVRFLGPRNDVPDILGASDVLMLASKTEGMPGIVIEAGVAGVPVAGYALSGVPEVVIAGSTGLLAPPGDVAHLAACVAELLADSDLRTRMGRAAHERCTGEFSIPPVAGSYLDVYRRLTNNAGRSLKLQAAK